MCSLWHSSDELGYFTLIVKKVMKLIFIRQHSFQAPIISGACYLRRLHRKLITVTVLYLSWLLSTSWFSVVKNGINEKDSMNWFPRWLTDQDIFLVYTPLLLALCCFINVVVVVYLIYQQKKSVLLQSFQQICCWFIASDSKAKHEHTHNFC